MHGTRISRALRLSTGIVLVGSAVAAGWWARPPTVIWILALVFTISYVIGRWPAWKQAALAGALGKAVLALPLTYLIQAALVGVLYLMGRGAGALGGMPTTASALTPFDAWGALVLTAVTALSGSVIARIELRAQQPAATAPEPAMPETRIDEIALLPTVVTPETFFRGIHFSHGSYDGPDHAFNGTPNTKSAGDEAKILMAEARLAIVLPESLKALYRVQNGGSVNSLCVPRPGIAEPRRFDDIVTPFSGYSDLTPLESLETLHEHITNYADPDDPDDADQFPPGCQQMVVLARWYNETLFMDYRQPGTPRVGFVDFERPDWDARCIWWNDFDAFFRSLRHFRTN